MKNILLLVAGLAAAAAYYLATRPVGSASANTPASDRLDHLAHRLQDAWSDHRTIA